MKKKQFNLNSKSKYYEYKVKDSCLLNVAKGNIQKCPFYLATYFVYILICISSNNSEHFVDKLSIAMADFCLL